MQVAGGRDPLGVEAWSLFLRSHAAVVRRIERELEDAERLPLAWYDVLLELNAAPRRRLRMQELGSRAVLSRTRVSRIVDELAADGLVVRERDPDDGRSHFAVITEQGRAALRHAAPVYLRSIEEHFAAHLTAQQLAAIRDGLTRVLAAHEPPSAPRPSASRSTRRRP